MKYRITVRDLKKVRVGNFESRFYENTEGDFNLLKRPEQAPTITTRRCIARRICLVFPFA